MSTEEKAVLFVALAAIGQLVMYSVVAYAVFRVGMHFATCL